MQEAIRYDNFPYYTLEDYAQWEDRWELIGGVAYAMAPAPYPRHQSVVVQMWRELDKALDCGTKNCKVFVSPIDWRINSNTVVQPDVAIFCEAGDLQYFTLAPPLIVEVLSRSTALKDVTTKYQLYQAQGVEYYIIIEPNTQIADIFRLLEGQYILQKKATKEDIYTFEMPQCKAVVDFGLVFED